MVDRWCFSIEYMTVGLELSERVLDLPMLAMMKRFTWVTC